MGTSTAVEDRITRLDTLTAENCALMAAAAGRWNLLRSQLDTCQVDERQMVEVLDYFLARGEAVRGLLKSKAEVLAPLLRNAS